MSRPVLVAVALMLAGCASSNLPEAYRSKNLPGTIDCSAYPQAPAPASCRNLYDNTIHAAVNSISLQ